MFVEGPQTQIFSNYFSNTLNNGTFSLQLFGFHPTSTIPKQRPARVCQNPGQIGYRIQDYDIKGNNEADRMANRAAEIAQIPELVSTTLRKVLTRCMLSKTGSQLSLPIYPKENVPKIILYPNLRLWQRNMQFPNQSTRLPLFKTRYSAPVACPSATWIRHVSGNLLNPNAAPHINPHPSAI